jgi:FkbM family methyltransferase
MSSSPSNLTHSVGTFFEKVWKALRLAPTPRWRAALKHRVAATIEHRKVGFGSDFASVLDVGGHHGQFTLFALETFPNAQITTFEPQAVGVQKIKAVTAGESRVTIQNFALSDAPGSAELQISQSTDSSSLLKIGKGQVEAYPGTGFATTETVQVETLDNLVTEPPARPALLKIDVQGFELPVLKGATRTLESIDTIFVECSFKELYEGQVLATELIEYVISRGFEIKGVFNVSQDSEGNCIQCDVLFVRSS